MSDALPTDGCTGAELLAAIEAGAAKAGVPLNALRGQERWGVGTVEQAFTGYQALPAPEQWWQVLGIGAQATRAEIDVAWRQLARSAHPDAGGTDAKMARLNAARDEGLKNPTARVT